MAAYTGAVERELLGPLRQEALAYPDPVDRAVGAELVRTLEVLSRAGPIAVHQATRHAEMGGAGMAGDPHIAQYLRLVGQLRQVAGAAARLRRGVRW